MRILLDESLPRRLKDELIGHDVHTVVECGWGGTKNGALLALAGQHFDVLITADQNLQHQQNLRTLPVAVAVLVGSDNRFQTLRLLIPELLAQLVHLAPNSLVRIES
jgi:hypothetical protein